MTESELTRLNWMLKLLMVQNLFLLFKYTRLMAISVLPMVIISVGIIVYAELSNNLKFQKHITVSHMTVLSGCSRWGYCTSSSGHSWTQTSPILGVFHPKDLIPICIHQQKGQGLGMPVGGYNRPGCNISFSPTSLAMMWSCGHRRSWEGQWIFMENKLFPCENKIVTPKEK